MSPTPFDRIITPLPSIREVAPGASSSSAPRPCRLLLRRGDQTLRGPPGVPDTRGASARPRSKDQPIKKTTDLVVSNKEDWKDIDEMFFRCVAAALKEFRESFPYFKGPFKDMGYQVQRYLPGEYYHWHIDGGSHEFSQRQLVVIWYLNDVPGPGGETEFLYQGREGHAGARQDGPVPALLDP